MKLNLAARKKLTGAAFAAPASLGLLLFYIAPFSLIIYYSLTRAADGKFMLFGNFTELFTNITFKLAMGNTLKFIFIGVPLLIVSSFLIASLLNRTLRGVSWFRMFLLWPLVVPTASTILVWQILFSGNGSVNSWLAQLGLEPVKWLNSEYAFWILLIMYIIKYTGYNVILFLAGLNSISREYYEAAGLDGADKWQLFRKITLPFILPTAFFVLIISIVNSFKMFREAYILAGKHPHESIYLLQHFMNNNFENLNYNRLSSAAMIVFVLIGTLVYLMYSREKKQKLL